MPPLIVQGRTFQGFRWVPGWFDVAIGAVEIAKKIPGLRQAVKWVRCAGTMATHTLVRKLHGMPANGEHGAR